MIDIDSIVAYFQKNPMMLLLIAFMAYKYYQSKQVRVRGGRLSRLYGRIGRD